MTFWLLFALFLSVGMFIALVGLFLLWAMSILGSWKAPYVPLPKEALPGIVEALSIDPGNVVYDIGCGDGRILRACAERSPHATYKGIERAWFPYLIARLHRSHPSVLFVRGDATLASFTDAHRVVLYLLPGFVDVIGEKIRRECAPGARVISVDFPIASWVPVQVIEQRHLPQRMRGRLMYVYILEKDSA